MIILRLRLLGLLVSLLPLASAAPDAADFAKPAAHEHVRLSPDGQTLAFVANLPDRESLMLFDRATRRALEVRPGAALLGVPESSRRRILGYEWLTADRVIFHTGVLMAFAGGSTGYAAVDRNGRGWQGLTAFERDGVTGFEMSPPTNRLWGRLIHNERDGYVVFAATTPGLPGKPVEVLRMNTRNGRFTTLDRNEPDLDFWLFDDRSRLRFGLRVEGARSTLHRFTEPAGWSEVRFERDPERYPLIVEGDGETMLVGVPGPEGRWALHRQNLTDGEPGEPLFAHERIDVGAPEEPLHFSGHPLQGVVYARAWSQLLGVRYVDDRPRTHWFDPNLARIQTMVDQALPGLANILVDFSDDGRHLLWLSFSDRHPGTYHLFDTTTFRLEKTLDRRPGLDPSRLGATQPVVIATAEGHSLPAYLTTPSGREAKGLPLVVIPPRAPGTRHGWGFDAFVQSLATRGYAVLQVNTRGSSGYGRRHLEAGRAALGPRQADDLAAAVKWAVDEGFADPQRVAAIGFEGGAATVLWALEQHPELYRCGVVVSAITDWHAIITKIPREQRQALLAWRRQLGDHMDDEAWLHTISPIHAMTKPLPPLLVVHGELDGRIPAQQSRTLASALAATKSPHDTYFPDNDGLSFVREDNRRTFYERAAAFLDKHLDSTP